MRRCWHMICGPAVHVEATISTVQRLTVALSAGTTAILAASRPATTIDIFRHQQHSLDLVWLAAF